MSSTYFLENGTPHGSVLSPLLFIIMINDLPESSNGVKLTLFADDTSMQKSGSNPSALSRDVQRHLTKTEKWASRSRSTSIRRPLLSKQHIPTDVVLKINNVMIKLEKTAKFLGVIFDRGLTWAAHIDYITDRCIIVRLDLKRTIRASIWGASKNIVIIVDKAIIRSVMDYGGMAYDSSAAKTKEKQDRLQGQALRICCGSLPERSRATEIIRRRAS